MVFLFGEFEASSDFRQDLNLPMLLYAVRRSVGGGEVAVHGPR